MSLTQAKRISLTEQVVRQIQARIESGEWPVGMRIPPEPELVKQLGVSRNTIREAVRALGHAGLLEARQGDGTYVCTASDLKAAMGRRLQRSPIEDTLEVRHCLEREAARLAAIRRSEGDKERLLRCLEQRSVTMAGPDKEAAVQADMELHKAVMEATHNALLIDIYANMTDALRISIDRTLLSDLALYDEYDTSHRKLVEAIVQGDADAAVQAANAYIEAAQIALRLNGCNESGE